MGKDPQAPRESLSHDPEKFRTADFRAVLLSGSLMTGEGRWGVMAE